MFTGIVQETGIVNKVVKSSFSTKLAVRSVVLYADAAVSDSIAVNGVCLTVVSRENNLISFDAVAPTLEKTNLRALKPADCVNLEPALKVGDKLGGHFVLGHVDGVSRLKKITNFGNYRRLEFDLSMTLRKYVVENGSVALDGVSLTVKKVMARSFTVDIIPFTWDHTTLRLRRPGYAFNLECDYLLKGKNNGK